MKLPLGPPPIPRRTSLLSRVFHSPRRGGPEDPDALRTYDAGEPQVTVAEVSAKDQTEAPDFETGLYREAQGQIKRHAWGRAQRTLEEVTRRDPTSPAALDLKSVRIVRRALRRIARWPSDVEAHLDLGRAWFDLDLGDEALGEFLTVQRLAPRRYEGYALAALEFLYRGEYTRAMSAWIRARELNPELPELEEVMGSLPAK